jgi:shikimate dehydrogenase
LFAASVPFIGVTVDKTSEHAPQQAAGRIIDVSVATAHSPALLADIARDHAERVSAAEGGGFLVGLIGRGIARSRSPGMHESEGRRLGATYTYALLDFDRLGLADGDIGAVLEAAEAGGFAGLNVTHPFKQLVIDHLTDLSPEAAAIGAVNTVVFRDRRRIGHNTDAWGFAASLRQDLADANLDKVVLFGAGGAGAAVGYALLESGTTALDVYDADGERATRLAARLTERFGRLVVAVSDPASAVRRAAGAVNATPVGMDKYPGTPFDPALLEPHQWVADIIYFPADTELLQRARSRGCRTLPGRGMAIFQAVKAFELFTGIAPDPKTMAQHFESAA